MAMAKVRFVLQGFDDRGKAFMVHDTSTLPSTSIRLILSITATRNLFIFSQEVNQMYLQRKLKLTPKICIRVKKRDLKTFGPKEDNLLELDYSLYGIYHAGDFWSVTFDEHPINDP